MSMLNMAPISVMLTAAHEPWSQLLPRLLQIAQTRSSPCGSGPQSRYHLHTLKHSRVGKRLLLSEGPTSAPRIRSTYNSKPKLKATQTGLHALEGALRVVMPRRSRSVRRPTGRSPGNSTTTGFRHATVTLYNHTCPKNDQYDSEVFFRYLIL